MEKFETATQQEFDEATKLFRNMWNYQMAREEAEDFDLPALFKLTKSDIHQGKHTYAVNIDLLEKTYSDFISFLDSKGLKADFKEMVKSRDYNYKKPIVRQASIEVATTAQTLSDLMSTTPQDMIDEGIEKPEFIKLDDKKAQAKFNWVSNYMNSYSRVDNRTVDESGNTKADEIEFYENQVIEMIKQGRGTSAVKTMLDGKIYENDNGEKETHYSMKQIGEMGELLKAAQRLKEKTGEDYLSVFSNIPYVDDYLRKIKSDKSGDFATMMKEAQQKLQGNN